MPLFHFSLSLFHFCLSLSLLFLPLSLLSLFSLFFSLSLFIQDCCFIACYVINSMCKYVPHSYPHPHTHTHTYTHSYLYIHTHTHMVSYKHLVLSYKIAIDISPKVNLKLKNLSVCLFSLSFLSLIRDKTK